MGGCRDERRSFVAGVAKNRLARRRRNHATTASKEQVVELLEKSVGQVSNLPAAGV